MIRRLIDSMTARFRLSYWAGYRDGIAAAGEALHVEYRFTKRVPKRVRDALELEDAA